ncbi:hypothetical protein LTR57_017899 [Friedmanniomyces endolithicus]|nr:hypothetical protein LTR38_002164 [Friedmanniomyces endolithicus]KAK0818943.1 hypothetical protein LTR75_002399 [Friedmanniomyces endolithicus]KAK0884174.1 hypothetical protein LTR87_002113 [Friedmanniomyces endolithicus]KAK0906140.1 hypothetical protein LTR57_017899 [Friedmanniomyces endolithicus]KAK0967664.1 hypothetical protein LTS01_017183 [Friedmanniomyces endolithicus]
MLSRPATKISLTLDDIYDYERRKAARDSMRADHMNSSEDTSNSAVDDGVRDQEMTAAQETRAAKSKAAREQRILGGPSRG